MILSGENARIILQPGSDVLLIRGPSMTMKVVFGKSRILLIIVGVVLVLFIGLIDYTTGPELSLSIFYLVPIILASLYIDFFMGIVLAATSVGVSLFADIAAARVHGDYGVAYWNTGVKLCVYLVVIYILAGRRRAEKNVQLYAQLHEIDRETLAETNPEQVSYAALRGLQKVVPFECATVSLVDMETENGTLFVWMNDQKLDNVPMNFSLEHLEEELPLLREGKIVHLENGQAVTPILPFHELSRSILVPLSYQGELVGSLNLGRRNPRDFLNDELDIVREVSTLLTIAVTNAKLFERLRESRDRLKLLSQRLLEVQEQERRHLARELHDEMGQALTAIKISLQTIENLPKSAEFRVRIRENIEGLESILQQVRSLTVDLRPLMLDDLGLVAALRWYLSKQSQIVGFAAHFSTEPSEIQVPPEIGTACFRIVQEALTNVARHSKATKVNLRLQSMDSHLYCTIQDDGVGFDVAAAELEAQAGRSMGVLGMKERATLAGGWIEIESVPSYGTEIRAVFPLHPANHGEHR